VLAIDRDGRPGVYLAIAVACVATGALMLSAKPSESAAGSQAAPASGAAGMSRLAWFMAAVLFLYVGAEFGLGSWVASYADEEFEAGVFAGGVITAGYWGALMVGRLVSGAMFARAVPAGSVLLASIFAGMLTSAGIAVGNDAFALAVGAAFLTGLAFGPIWPAAMAIAAEGRSANAPAALVTIGNSGGFVFPWLQGRLLVSEGPATGIALSAALCGVMLMVAWWGVKGQAGMKRSAS